MNTSMSLLPRYHVLVWILGLFLLSGCQWGFFPLFGENSSPGPDSVSSQRSQGVTPEKPTEVAKDPTKLYETEQNDRLVSTLSLLVTQVNPTSGEITVLNRSRHPRTWPWLHFHSLHGKESRSSSDIQGFGSFQIRLPFNSDQDFLLVVAEHQGLFYPVSYLEYGKSFAVSFKAKLWSGSALSGIQRGESYTIAQANFRGQSNQARHYAVQSSSERGKLQGQLVNEQGTHIEGATVEARCDQQAEWGTAGQTTSDTQGRFQWLSQHPAGVCWLMIRAQGYLPSIRAVLTTTHVLTTFVLAPVGKPGQRTAQDTVTFPGGVTLRAQATDLDQHGTLYFTEVSAISRSHLDLDPMNAVAGYAVHGQQPQDHLYFRQLAVLRIPTPSTLQSMIPSTETHAYFLTDASDGTTSGIAYLRRDTIELQVTHFSTKTIELGAVDFGALRFLIRSEHDKRELNIQDTCACSNKTRQDTCIFQPYLMQLKQNESLSLEATRDLHQAMQAALSGKASQQVEASIDKIVAKNSAESSASLSAERKLHELLKLQLAHGRETQASQSCGGGTLPASPCLNIQRKAHITTRKDSILVQQYQSKISNTVITGAFLINPGAGIFAWTLSNQATHWVTLRQQEAYPVDENCEIKDTYTLENSCNCSQEEHSTLVYEGGIKKLSSGGEIPNNPNTTPVCGQSFYVEANLVPIVVPSCQKSNATLLQELGTATANLLDTLRNKCVQSCKAAGLTRDKICEGQLGTIGERNIEATCQIPYYGSRTLSVHGVAACYCYPKPEEKKEPPKPPTKP